MAIDNRQPARHGWRFFVGSNTFLQVLVGIVGLAFWEAASRSFDLDFWISSPTAVATELVRWERSGHLWVDLRVTMTEASLGFIVGCIAGGFTGFVLGWTQRLGDILEPYIVALYSIPKIALAPLFVLWLGIGVTNKVMFAAMLVFFIVFFTTYRGVRSVDRELVQNAWLLGANRWDIWTKIAIPYSAVWMLTGLRIALPDALIGAIVGEFVASDAGVGYRIKEATAFVNTAGVFAGLFVLLLISLCLLSLLKLIENRTLRWQAGDGAIATEPGH
ncbi:ABC transporter permease [Mesorhizobium sp. LHD-90]|uniref:ABC transporter permease n=1 Tax=Mesorhizobium sp. LHD-90 TaxID=3071414 RepID=UPI0027E03F7F|nr:ABC transporter permease [Mesorhizobium sp. LHD-90]MDQ6433189.1 ABC transporter permease [Mesorhizobium sp. LHD-90]